MWCSACHMTATATSHGRVVCGRCLDPAAPATIAPWSTLIRIPSCRPEPRVIFIPSPSADTSWLKVSTKFRGDFHNIPLDIGMQYLCLFISWVYSVLNIVKICVISFTAKAARWCQATAPPRWHVMVTDPCLVPTLCWCDTLTAALHLTSHEPAGYIYIYISTYLRFYISTLDNIVPLCWTVELPITVAAAAGDVDPCDTGPALRRSQDMVWIFERPVKSASPATCTRVLHWLSATQHQVRRHWPSAGAGAAPPPATDPGSASVQGPIHTLHQGWSFRFLYKI